MFKTSLTKKAMSIWFYFDSNERSGNSTFYWGIHEFLNHSIIEKNNCFWKFYSAVDISQKILWNGNYSINIVIFQKDLWQLCIIFYFTEFKIYTILEKNNGFYALVAISQNFLWNCNYSIEFQKIIIFQNIDGISN